MKKTKEQLNKKNNNMNTKMTIYRKGYTARTTMGELFFYDITGKFCYILEDTVRAPEIKVKRETALPAGLYKVSITHSSRFKREMPIIYTENNKYEVLKDGIRFIGCRFHGGNTHKNTEGCPLVAHNKLDDETIQGSAEKEVTAKIRALIADIEDDFVWLEIINEPQKN